MVAAFPPDCCTHWLQSCMKQKFVAAAYSTALQDLAPEVVKQIETLAWDSAQLCAVAGQCTVPCCVTETSPEQIHLALGVTPSEMSVMWTVAFCFFLALSPNLLALVWASRGSYSVPRHSHTLISSIVAHIYAHHTFLRR